MSSEFKENQSSSYKGPLHSAKSFLHVHFEEKIGNLRLINTKMMDDFLHNNDVISCTSLRNESPLHAGDDRAQNRLKFFGQNFSKDLVGCIT